MGCRTDVRLPSSTDSHTGTRAGRESVTFSFYIVVSCRDRSVSGSVPSAASVERGSFADSVDVLERQRNHGQGGIQRPESLYPKLRATPRSSAEPSAISAHICRPRRSPPRQLNAVPAVEVFN